MKKLLTLIVFLGLVAPLTAFATTSAPWSITNLTDSFIFPNLINGAKKGILVSASSTINANLSVSSLTSGNCVQASTGGLLTTTGSACSANGSAFPFTPTTNFGALANATSTPIWFKAGLQASSTIEGSNGASLDIASSGYITQGGVLVAVASSTTGGTFFGQGAGGPTIITNSTLNKNVGIGYQALGEPFGDGGANNTVAVGYQACEDQNSGANNVCIGSQAMAFNVFGSGNMAIGTFSLFQSSGNFNVGVGFAALDGAGAFSGRSNVGIGYQVGESFLDFGGNSANGNTLIGFEQGPNINIGSENTEIGDGQNVSNDITTGNFNIKIGAMINLPNQTANGQLDIQNILFGINNQAINGQLATSTIGVGTTSPFARFSIHANNGDTNNVLFAIGSSTATATTTLFAIDNVGHVNYKAASSTCGSGCSNIVGNDDGGTVTTGTLQTAVTVNFGAGWSSTPVCTVTDNSTTIAADISSISSTAFTVGLSAALTGTIYYQCANYK